MAKRKTRKSTRKKSVKKTTKKRTKKSSCSACNIFVKKKKQLTFDQEFEIMKLVLDKFLWLGFAIMAFGMFFMITSTESIYKGLSFMIIGAIILLLFMILIVREYELVK